jgi:Rhodopirellula transposase DDE domain
MHDFVDPELGRAIPYGIYDEAHNEGWISVGDTAEFANTHPVVVVHHHVDAARALGVRSPKGEDDKTHDLHYAGYITSIKQYLYSQAWIDRLVMECGTQKASRRRQAGLRRPFRLLRQNRATPTS